MPAHALRISVNPLSRLARLRCLTAPTQQGLLLAVAFLLVASTAHAAGSSMPWGKGRCKPFSTRSRGRWRAWWRSSSSWPPASLWPSATPAAAFASSSRSFSDLSIAFAASSFFLSFLQLLRRGCRMSAPDQVAIGFEVPLLLRAAELRLGGDKGDVVRIGAPTARRARGGTVHEAGRPR